MAPGPRALAGPRCGAYAGVAASPAGSVVPDAQNPNALTDCPGPMRAAHEAGVTVTCSPLRATVPFHESRITEPVGSVNARRQPLTSVVPELRTVTLRHRPVSHVESRFTLTTRGLPGAGAGVPVPGDPVPPPGVVPGVPAPGAVPPPGLVVPAGVVTVIAVGTPAPCRQMPVSE